MVKKLLKYEWASFVRSLLPMEMILLGIALLTRIVQFFENDTTAYAIVSGSSVAALSIACVVCLVMTVAVNVTRFYRNLYTAEGYLSFTLPVTYSQHIAAKLCFAVLSTVFSVLSILAAGVIATAGEVLHEVVKALVYLFRQCVETLGWQTLWFGLDALAALLVIVCGQYLLYYACATLGQLAKKNRVLASFGFYFVYYLIRQTIGTVLMVVYFAVVNIAWFKNLLDWLTHCFDTHPYASAHAIIWLLILFGAAVDLLYFGITYIVMKRKLNLE